MQADFKSVEAGRLLTSGVFVVHLRSNSDPEHRHVLGRIEHVVSANSRQFRDLSEMLAFMAQHQGRDGRDEGREKHVSATD